MAAMSPSVNDREETLWFKAAWNLYVAAIASGAVNLTPPRYGEMVFSLQKKAAYYTAIINPNV
jgi:hypothetical protein